MSERRDARMRMLKRIAAGYRPTVGDRNIVASLRRDNLVALEAGPGPLASYRVTLAGRARLGAKIIPTPRGG
jgi:hypothetical protein